MAKDDADLFQVLLRQIGQDAEVNPVLSKALSILGNTKLIEQVR